jgi:uncharacterized protein
MAVDHIRYDILAQEALRGVVQTVLKDAAKNGLPGEHHFYVTFETRAEGVRMPSRLLAQFPEAMTIVLQHQFWDLRYDRESQAISVGLSFGGVPSILTIPLDAVVEFADPHIRYGLRFQPADLPVEAQAPEAEVEPESPPAPSEPAQVVSLDAFRRRTPQG